MVARAEPWEFPLLAWLRYVAVGLVCFNHLSVTLLKLPAPLVPAACYVVPAGFGLTLLFVTSGFLIHWHYRNRLGFGPSWAGRAAAYLVRRWFFLWPPVVLILAVDLFAGNFSAAENHAAVARSLPAFLTLTQNWRYALQGNATAGFPFVSSNIAWLASDLFFAYIAYLLLGPVVARVRRGAFFLLLAVAGLHVATQFWLARHVAGLDAWALAEHGPRAATTGAPAVFSFLYWLFHYSPVSRLAEFVIGIFSAEYFWRQRSQGGAAAPGRLLAIVAVLGILIACADLGSWQPNPVTALDRLHNYDLLGAALVLTAASCGHRFGAAGPLSLPASAYVLWMWHLHWYNAYVLPALAAPTSLDWFFVVGRFVAINSFVVLTAWGLHLLLMRWPLLSLWRNDPPSPETPR